jgi:hypothetical protein
MVMCCCIMLNGTHLTLSCFEPSRYATVYVLVWRVQMELTAAGAADNITHRLLELTTADAALGEQLKRLQQGLDQAHVSTQSLQDATAALQQGLQVGPPH